MRLGNGQTEVFLRGENEFQVESQVGAKYVGKMIVTLLDNCPNVTFHVCSNLHAVQMPSHRSYTDMAIKE